MRSSARFAWAVLALGFLLASGPARAEEKASGLTKGTPDLKSAGPLAFGPHGILFVGDPQGAAVFALDVGDRAARTGAGPLNVTAVDGKIASLLGTTEKDILVNDLAVNPVSGNAYLSVSRGKGPDASPVLLRVDREGKIEEVSLKDVPFAKATLPNPATGRGRQDAITKLAYVDGKVYVACMSNEEFSSQLRSIPFPFKEVAKGAGVEIYHGSHGRFETNSPVRTFVPYDIKGEGYLLAAYTCTPLVKIPVAELKPGNKVKGVTVAELGNHNRPLDMIAYQKDGKNYILMANSARGLMKITLDNLDKIEPIKSHVDKTAGLTYETLADLKGVMQLDQLDKEHALLLVKTEAGSLNLQTVPLP